MVTSEPQHQKNKGIQFLRAVAVLSVIVFHLNDSWLPGGFVGVDVFFVISGFVITQSLVRNWNPKLTIFLGQFYSRRVLRIVPALFVFLAVTALLVALFVPRGFFLGGDGPQTGLWAVFGLSNLSLYWSDRGYFDERIEFNAFSHTWSLGVEEQFYLLFPLLLWIALLLVHSQKRRIGIGLAVLALPTLLSLMWAVGESANNPQAAFYLLPSRFWELGVGAILAYLLAHGAVNRPRPLTAGLSHAFGGVFLGAGFLFAQSAQFPFPWALPAVVGTALMIYGFQAVSIGTSRGFSRVADWQVFQTVGDWSYSLYLWHWAVVVLMRWTVGVEYWWHYLVAIVATFALAGLSYRFIEKPVLDQRIHEKTTASRILVTTGLIAAGWAGSLWAGDKATNRFVSQSVTASGEIFSPPDYVGDAEETYAQWSGIGEGRKVILVGDSHSGHFGTLLTEMRAVTGFEYEVVDDRSCPVASLVRPRGDCTEYREDLERVMASVSPGDVVVLSSLRTPRISDIVDGQTSSIEQVTAEFEDSLTVEAQAVALDEAQRAIEQMRDAGATVLVTTPTPVFPSPVFRCVDWFNAQNPACAGGFTVDRETSLKLAQPANTTIAALEEQGLIKRWNLFDVLCPDSPCQAERDDRYLFYDGDHLSSWGNHILIPSFVDIVVALWGDHSPAAAARD